MLTPAEPAPPPPRPLGQEDAFFCEAVTGLVTPQTPSHSSWPRPHCQPRGSPLRSVPSTHQAWCSLPLLGCPLEQTNAYVPSSLQKFPEGHVTHCFCSSISYGMKLLVPHPMSAGEGDRPPTPPADRLPPNGLTASREKCLLKAAKTTTLGASEAPRDPAATIVAHGQCPHSLNQKERPHSPGLFTTIC